MDKYRHPGTGQLSLCFRIVYEGCDEAVNEQQGGCHKQRGVVASALQTGETIRRVDSAGSADSPPFQLVCLVGCALSLGLATGSSPQHSARGCCASMTPMLVLSQ